MKKMLGSCNTCTSLPLALKQASMVSTIIDCPVTGKSLFQIILDMKRNTEEGSTTVL
jgi:hypothetical protein